MRRIPLIPIILSLVTVAVIMTVYLVLRDFQRKAMQTATDPYSGIAVDAEMIFHIKSPALFRESFALTGPLGQDLEAIFTGRNPAGIIHRIDSLAAAAPLLSDYRNTAYALLSLHPEGNTPLADFLLQVPFPARIDQQVLNTFIQEKLFPDYGFRSRTDNRQTYFSAEKSDNTPQLQYTINHNILAVSSSLQLIQQMDYLHETGTAIASDSRFSALRNAAGRFSDNL